MNFTVFSAGNINVFPCANTHNGGQLMTEYNLRSRESIEVPEAIKYMSGKSYLHSKEDFEVSMQTDDTGTVLSSSILEIAPGRGLINGHYVESLTPVIVDIAEANARARSNGDTVLKGNLTIGLKVMYSTEQTMAGAMIPENEDYLFEGVQVVVLPKNEFILPIDSPNDEGKVTAHIKLADFIYLNGAVNQSSIVNNYPDKCLSIDAHRIGNFQDLISGDYLKKTGLNPDKLYVFSGAGTNDGKDAWCEANDALMIWDRNNNQTTTPQPNNDSAKFQENYTTGEIQLHIPHKQVDTAYNTAGEQLFYEPVDIPLPVADFIKGTSGTVDINYTKNIRAIREQINTLYNLPAGRQIGYIDILNNAEDLPPMNQSWNVGDYILVGQDNVAGAGYADSTGRAPSTIYIVLPGLVKSVKYVANLSGVDGMQVDSRAVSQEPNTTESDVYNEEWGMPSTVIRGTVEEDYLTVVYTDSGEDVKNYYYVVEKADKKELSAAVYLTGGVPLASEEAIGGFYNAPSTAIGGGYVGLDDTGHLRVLDYSLLVSGVLAYQLGEDVTIGSNSTAEAIQDELNQVVNNRVAFANDNHIQNGDNQYVINVTLELSEEGEPVTITVENIDSRFGTSVMLNILGTANENTTINVINCEKLRISNNIGGTPKINIQNCCLYYDANILDKLNSIADLKLWYQKFEATDPDLVINDMTVTSVDAPIVTEEIDYWSTEAPNDNHYSYALRSITFSDTGVIVGMGMYIRNNTTANNALGTSIVAAKFRMPQGSGLSYPVTKLLKPVKIDGDFISAYPSTGDPGYMVVKTSFTAISQTYDANADDDMNYGTISCLVNASLVDVVTGVPYGTAIDGWNSNSFHIFEGGVIG